MRGSGMANVKAFAENLMMRLNVPDLDAWWQVASQLQLDLANTPRFASTHRKHFLGAGKSTSSIWLACAGTLARHDRPVWADPDFRIDPDPSRPEECRSRRSTGR